MPFFSRPAYLAPEPNFFQLLAELDNAASPKCSGARQQHRNAEFTPRFDVTETKEAYELYGELPGIEQADISIEFSDAQTLVIKGKTERAYTKAPQAAEPAAEVLNEKQDANENDAASEKSHNATVEDDYDVADTPLATPATTTTLPAEEKAQSTEATTTTPQADKPKFWVSERRVGSFARSFSFSQRIEQDAVTASLKNGVLAVVVPKSVKKQRIAVSVA
jgi:HSP20 family protein